MTNKYRIKDIGINDIIEEYFEKNNNSYQIDIIDILAGLSSYQFDINDFDIDDIDKKTSELLLSLTSYDLTNKNGFEKLLDFNSYNNLANINHDIQFTIYEHDNIDGFFMDLQCHRFGDIRGNYTPSALLYFDYKHIDDILEEIREISRIYHSVQYEEVDYLICTDVFSEGYTIDFNNTQKYLYEYIESDDDFINCLKNNDLRGC